LIGPLGVDLADSRAQGVGDGGQRGIAGGVTKCVIHQLEVI
jgi:hypothetical protein